jgi:hypothetical protein
MPVVTRKRSGDFAIIPNAIADDNSLTYEARGLLCYLLAKPHNWKVQVTNIQKAGGIGRDKAYRLLSELKDAGYVVLTEEREPGTNKILGYSYTVYDCAVPAKLPFPENPETAPDNAKKPAENGPLPENQETGEPLPEKAASGKSGSIKKKEGIKKTKPPLPPEQPETTGEKLFCDMWDMLKQEQRPKKRDEALKLFLGLEDADQRLAHQLFPFFLKEAYWSKRPPQLFTYLKTEGWIRLAAPPRKDPDGYFVIDWYRPEWQAWLDHILATKGAEEAARNRAKGQVLCKRRWPSDPRTEKADRHD